MSISSKAEITKTVGYGLSFISLDALHYMRMMAHDQMCLDNLL